MSPRVRLTPMRSLVVAVLLSLAAPAVADGVKEGDHYVELDAKTAAGKNFRLKTMAGKWVLFTFGAKWCAPCHKELPAWDKLAAKYTGKVVFVAVNINNKVDEGKAFVDSLHLKHMFPVFMPADSSAAMSSYNPDHMPSTYVIDPKGIVRLVHYEYHPGDEDALGKQLDSLIGG